ncbi:MAG: hypothetical protein QM790_06545 [Nibricoccus sp.]
MWRFRLDGVPHVFIGGLAGKETDVKKTTSFFLVPEYLWDSKRFNPQLQPDGFSFHLGGGELPESTISDSRIYRLTKREGKRFTLEAISGPLPASPTRQQMLHILGKSLGREVIEERPNQKTLDHNGYVRHASYEAHL